MRNEIIKGREFYIISRSIDNAEKCTVIDVLDGSFKVKLKNLRRYEAGETAELFTCTPDKRMYFETIVQETEDDIISLWFPITIKCLQRREFSRIASDKKIILYDETGSINAEISNISPGGLKVITPKQLELLKKYKTVIEIDNKEIKTEFIPARIEVSGRGFISSGRFETTDGSSMISLAQYCFRRQAENGAL